MQASCSGRIAVSVRSVEAKYQCMDSAATAPVETGHAHPVLHAKHRIVLHGRTFEVPGIPGTQPGVVRPDACRPPAQRFRAAFRASQPANRQRSRKAAVQVLSAYGVVITGGSKGVGKALAEEFLKAGDSVVLCARNGEGGRGLTA
jgi:short chain dehydrogenase